MYRLLYKILPLLLIVLTLFSVQQWLTASVTSTFLSWIVSFCILFIIIFYRIKMKGYLSMYIPKIDLLILTLYFIWLIFNSIRGAYIAEGYWEYKQLTAGVLALSIPVFSYIFSVPQILKSSLSYWFKYALWVFGVIIPFLSLDAWHFYLGPIFVMGCFLPILPAKWKYVLAVFLVAMLFIDLDARSQVIKSAIVLMVALGLYFHRLVADKLLRFVHWLCYLAPVILLYLGLTGTFNIFEGLASNEGKYVEKKMVNGVMVESDLSVDTRTFIYKEVILSALKYDYVLWGRTPARGNDSLSFGDANFELTGKYERHSNELCHTNVFTWLGLIGVVLYSFIYLRSSYLAVYKSNNIFMKYVGCFIAFRWAFGWIEDFNSFNIVNVALWMLIAMGLSIQFREMKDIDFMQWVQSVFKSK